MTAISYVSKTQMEKETGFKHALGYAKPKEDKILIRKGLDKKTEKKVRAHEEEHILKGEEGPFLEWLIPAAIGLFGAKKSSDAAKDATNAQIAAGDKEIEFLKESRDLARGDTSPYQEAGIKAVDKLSQMVGLGPLSTKDQALSGLGGGGGGQGQALTAEGSPWADSPWKLSWENGQYVARLPDGTTNYWNDSSQSWQSSRASAYGTIGDRSSSVAAIFRGRAGGGPLYNVNELGPESIYSGGSYTRTPMPKTTPGDPNGYVKPNIVGRAIGGFVPTEQRMGNLSYLGGGRDIDWGGVTGVQPGPTTNSGYSRPGDYYGGPVNPKRDNGAVAGGGNADYSGGPVQSLPGQGQAVADPAASTGYPTPQENPYPFQTDPGYQFRLNEGMRALERSAGAAGGLLSGGFGRKALRYAQDYASGEYANVYNRIANIAGLGQVGVQTGANAALMAGQGMGNAAAGVGNARASGYAAQGNVWSNAANTINANVPWETIFGKKTTGQQNGEMGPWGIIA